MYQWCEFKFRGGRTKICQLKNLILTLLGKICKCTCIYMYIFSALLGTSPSKGTSAGCKMLIKYTIISVLCKENAMLFTINRLVKTPNDQQFISSDHW